MNLGTPVKNLKLSVITVCFGIIFILVNGATGCYAFHDLGPCHIDTNLVACIHVNHDKSKFTPLIHGPIFSLILPETPPHPDLLSTEEIHPPAFAYFSQFPSRASPA
jgi:hypothetical protein